MEKKRTATALKQWLSFCHTKKNSSLIFILKIVSATAWGFKLKPENHERCATLVRVDGIKTCYFAAFGISTTRKIRHKHPFINEQLKPEICIADNDAASKKKQSQANARDF